MQVCEQESVYFLQNIFLFIFIQYNNSLFNHHANKINTIEKKNIEYEKKFIYLCMTIR